jgi:peptide-methionine (S)-S-oxide reductase
MQLRLRATGSPVVAATLLVLLGQDVPWQAAQADGGPAARSCIQASAPAEGGERMPSAAPHPVTPEEATRPASDAKAYRTEVATFGMGCFWGAEADFCGVEGVIDTQVGYAGGRSPNPTYRQVSSGRTGHAEVVRVTFDPSVVSYEALLEVFWREHDPTTPNRQGPDVGTQYRSLILFHGPEQERAARASLQRHGHRLARPIVTEIAAASAFYPAEDYHQRYLERRGRASCNPRR